MTDFQPTNAQGAVIAVLVNLIGMTGVHRRPEQDGDVILDLMPASHVLDQQPFCVRITPDGVMVPIADKDAGVTERPSMLKAMVAESAAVGELLDRLRDDEPEGSGPFGF